MVKSKILLNGHTQFHFTYENKDISTDIAEDVETTFDTSSYELDMPLPKGYNKKVIDQAEKL